MTAFEKMQQGLVNRIAEERPYQEINATTPLPPIISAKEFREKTIVRPPEIIKGILSQGARLILAGPSKSRKSWVLLDLAYSIASGNPWLGFSTTRARVLYVNFELRNHTIHDRINKISDARTITNDELLDLWDLRGFAKSIEEMVVEINERIKTRDPYSTIILNRITKKSFI